ncbi:MAG: 2-oxoacid:acceptor oxidoreductase subunit alpha [Candidatus Caldatribacteriaceae bacterium]
MKRVDWVVKIGGAAGQGVQTVSEVLSLFFLRNGYFVFTIEDYQSRIRGGHTFTSIRCADSWISGMRKEVDILVCLDEETYRLHAGEVKRGEGAVIGKVDVQNRKEGVHALFIDFEEVAKGLGHQVFANMVATGAVLGILGMSLEGAKAYVREIFSKKGEEVVTKNESALEEGVRAVAPLGPLFALPKIQPSDNFPRYLVSGNEALGLGALLAGCAFYVAYPMTPSTGILNFLSSRAEEYGIVVEQAEDEIAAINMALGASYAGMRAMTATSGGGFCLMCEGLGLAAVTETPIVVVDAQRPGPSTGLPTRTAQGDLLFVIHASHDEFPRFVFAPRDPQDALNTVIRAFNLAEKYQVPAIILSDQYLADTKWSYSYLSLEERPVHPSYPLRGSLPYKRYALTEDGISPRLFPGKGEFLVVADSDEHDEFGHLTEDLEIRKKMHEKRMRKFRGMREEMRLPFAIKGRDATLVGWGSTWGVLLEARKELGKRGKDVGVVHFTDLYPLPQGIYKFLLSFPKLVVVEHNFTGQLAEYLRQETLSPFPNRICRYDGRPFLAEELVEEVEEALL